ncbi:MAG: pyridoxal phosphate-dependent aminotransferase [Pseudomonadota bacterium]
MIDKHNAADHLAPPLTPIADDLPSTVPFVGPEALERASGAMFRARIGANESVFGPSPAAIEAMATAARETWKYGDPELCDLKSALAAKHGVSPDNIAIGEGIDGLQAYTARLYMRPGETMVTSAGAYPTMNYHVAGNGGRIVAVPFAGDHEDPEALLSAAVREKARIVFFVNPDNPMGSWHDAGAVQRMIDDTPAETMLLLDEAYCETAPSGVVPPLDVDRPNVLRFRTFSKAMGLAGLRVGYVIGRADVVRNFDKIRNHFGVGRVAQAGALAALEDVDWLSSVIAQIKESRERISEIAARNGLTALPSATNFVAVDCGAAGAFARAVLEELGEQGVFVRMPGVAPLDRCIRISAGTAADMDLLTSALPLALQAARARLS